MKEEGKKNPADWLACKELYFTLLASNCGAAAVAMKGWNLGKNVIGMECPVFIGIYLSNYFYLF